MKAEFTYGFVFFGQDASVYGTYRPDGPSFIGRWDGTISKSYSSYHLINPNGYTYCNKHTSTNIKKFIITYHNDIDDGHAHVETDRILKWATDRDIDLDDMSDEESLIFIREISVS